jgi:hypothetical protein
MAYATSLPDAATVWRRADGLIPVTLSKGVPGMRIELVDLFWWLRKR